MHTCRGYPVPMETFILLSEEPLLTRELVPSILTCQGLTQLSLTPSTVYGLRVKVPRAPPPIPATFQPAW